MRPSNGSVTIATIPSSSALDSIQRALQELDAPNEVSRPPGGFRAKRCEHGLLCDEHEWLCEFCEPHTEEELAAKQRLLDSYDCACARSRVHRRGHGTRVRYTLTDVIHDADPEPDWKAERERLTKRDETRKEV